MEDRDQGTLCTGVLLQHAAMLRSLLWGSRVLLLLLALALVPTDADGTFFATSRVSPGTPSQQALLIHQDGIETLVLQSAWKGEGPIEKLLWIVPVPAVPEVAGMDKAAARHLFEWDLWRITAPVVKHWGPYFLTSLWFLLLGYLILARKYTYVVGHLLITMMCCLTVPASIGDRGSLPGAPWTITSGSTGAYDYQVLGATDAQALFAWFQERGYPVRQEDISVFQDYLSKGWRFVAVQSTAVQEPKEGLAPPLVLRFPSIQPIYPLALTATKGIDTKILLFCFSDHRLDAQGRLPCIGAKNLQEYPLNDKIRSALSVPYQGDEKNPVLPLNKKPYTKSFPTFLTTFWGTMSAKDMRTDLVLTPAASDEEYRLPAIWRF